MEFKTKEVRIDQETRYVLVEKNTDKLLDDAQGYGYKTAQGAHKAGWYKYQGGRKKKSTEKKISKRFWKEHPELKDDAENILNNLCKEIGRGERKGGITPSEYADIERETGIPKAALDNMEFD